MKQNLKTEYLNVDLGNSTPPAQPSRTAMEASRAVADPGTVGEVMVRRPKWSPADATIADVRALFVDNHVHMALLVRQDRLMGTVLRADLDATTGPGEPALTLARLEGRTVTPESCLAPVRSRMIATGQRRLAVVDHDGRLLGLLCLKRAHHGFCSDRDVASREEACVAGSAGGPSTPRGR